MVSTETLQVIINAKDMLSEKIRQVNNTIRQTGTTASTSSSTATSAVNRIGLAYEQLRNKVTSIWNSIRSTISNTSIAKSVTSSGLAQPFLNAAETIKQRWTSMVETIKSKLRGMNSSASSGSGFNISNAGLATLNGQITTTSTKVTALSRAINAVGSVSGTLGIKLGTAFTNAGMKIDAFKTKLSAMGSKMTGLVSGLSGVQSAIMGAFGAVGVTSLTQFTIGAAVARQKLNAVTTSITGSEAATRSLNKAISSATSGGIIGFTKVAQAVQQIGIKYNLTNAQLEKTAPVLNKIGTLARAMGKDSETAATLMSKAYDGLNGNFMLLKRNLGITKEQLLDAGWSGAANDVDGYTLALQKVLDTKPEMQEYLNSFEGQQERLQLAIQGVGRSIGEIVLPVLNAVLGFFLEMHKNAPWLTTAIVGIGIAILGVISILTVLAPILFLIEEEIIAINLATLWPLIIVAAIIAVIAVLKHLYDTNEQVRQVIDNLANSVRGIFSSAWEHLTKILQPLGDAFNQLMGVFGRIATDILGLFGITGQAADEFDWLGAVINAVTLYIQGFIQMITIGVEFIAAILIPVITLVVNIISSLVLFITQLAEAFSLLLQGDIAGFFTVLGNALFTLIQSTILNIGNMFLQIYMNLNTIFGNVLAVLWAWISQFVMSMVMGAYNAVTGFFTWISQLPGRLWTWLLNAIQKVLAWREQTKNNFIQAATQAVNGFINWIKTLPDKFKTWLDNTIAKIVSFAKSLYDKMKDAARQAVDGFKEKIKNLPTEMWNALMNMKQKIYDGAGALVEALKNLGWRMLEGFKNALLGDLFGAEVVTTLQGNLINAYKPLRRTAMGLGEEILAGFNSAGNGLNTTLTGVSTGELSYSVSHNIQNKEENNILHDILQILTQILEAEESDTLVDATLEQTGTITLKHDVNLANVPPGVDEATLTELIKQTINSRDVIKELTSNREFQNLDNRMKQKIIGEYSRHI